MSELKLIVEIDGDVHEREVKAGRDQTRDEKLHKLGYTILAISQFGDHQQPGRPH